MSVSVKACFPRDFNFKSIKKTSIPGKRKKYNEKNNVTKYLIPYKKKLRIYSMHIFRTLSLKSHHQVLCKKKSFVYNKFAVYL